MFVSCVNARNAELVTDPQVSGGNTGILESGLVARLWSMWALDSKSGYILGLVQGASVDDICAVGLHHSPMIIITWPLHSVYGANGLTVLTGTLLDIWWTTKYYLVW